jgi:hypothetical protein
MRAFLPRLQMVQMKRPGEVFQADRDCDWENTDVFSQRFINNQEYHPAQPVWATFLFRSNAHLKQAKGFFHDEEHPP